MKKIIVLLTLISGPLNGMFHPIKRQGRRLPQIRLWSFNSMMHKEKLFAPPARNFSTNIITFLKPDDIKVLQAIAPSLNFSESDVAAIIQAINHFNENPSATRHTGPIYRTLNVLRSKNISRGHLSNIQGSTFELIKALSLEKNGQNIEGFCTAYDAIEYDLQTQKKLIECKNISWSHRKTEENAALLLTAFSRQLEKAKTLNKQYELHSRQPVPREWQKKLAQKEIRFIEGD